MKKTNISKFVAVGLCICALTGCGASPDEKPDTPEMYLLDGVSVLVLITASVLVSGIVILKRNPKDILSEMS